MAFKPTHGLLVRDWKQDVINLVQFPRCGCIVSTSPFAIKLETFIRFTKLNYVNVSNELKWGSAKGQIPFIELNGRQFADSSFIIENLVSIFNLGIDRHLSSRERAEQRALTVLIEESLIRAMVYDRSRDPSWFATDKGFIAHLSGLKKFAFEKVVIKRLQSKMKGALQAQGIGRNTPDEVDEIFKKDLLALSTFLGDKAYVFGDKPTTIDATLFGALVSIYDTPLNSKNVKPFIEQNTPNLVTFMKRVKDEYWPDWDTLTHNLVMNATDKPTVGPAAAEAAGTAAPSTSGAPAAPAGTTTVVTTTTTTHEEVKAE
ncbi:failed axon connections protein [Aphelenchoides avenae]|nr:failed axon connections protein [Aphelenchus avenae]